MTSFLASISGQDVVAVACVVVGTLCLLLRRRVWPGLAAFLFTCATAAGTALWAYQHSWPGYSLLDLAAMLGAGLCLLWAVVARIVLQNHRRPSADAIGVHAASGATAPSVLRPDRSPAVLLVASFLAGGLCATVLGFVLIRSTWLRLSDPIAPVEAMTWPGLVLIGVLMIAVLLTWTKRNLTGEALPVGSRLNEQRKCQDVERSKRQNVEESKRQNAETTRSQERRPAIMLALAGLAVWWTSLMIPSAPWLAELPVEVRLPGQPGWWTWMVQLQVGLALLLFVAAVLQDHRYRRRRRNAWPERLCDLVEPYARRRGYIQTEAIIAGLILLLGILQLLRADRPGWQLRAVNCVASALAGATCLFMAYRRWSGNTAGLGMALVSLALVALACAAAAPFYALGPSVEYTVRIPVLLNAMLPPLWIAIGLWNWLSRVWDQQLLDGVAWTTTGRMIPIARLTGFLLAAIAVLVAFQMALWPTRAVAADEDNGTWRIVCGSLAILLLLVQSTREARRRDSPAVATIAMAFFLAAAAFVFVRLPTSPQRGWLIQYDTVVLSALALPILLAAEALRKNRWRSFSTPLWFLALLILPLRAMLELLSPLRLPAEWVRPMTLTLLGMVYSVAGRREHRRAFLVLGAVLLLAAAIETFQLLRAHQLFTMLF